MIIDDEPIAHRIIEDYASMLGGMELRSNCYDALQAIQYLNSTTVDLIFLDLNMPKLKGFEFLKTLQNPPKIIVTTAYAEYAVEGFELNVSDYLLKPFGFDRFIKAINKLGVPENVRLVAETEPSTSSTFFLKGDKKYHQVNLDDIVYIEADGNYAKVYLKHQMIRVHEKISWFEETFDLKKFIRIHKSFMVSVSHITTVEGATIKMGAYHAPIGKLYKKSVYDRLGF